MGTRKKTGPKGGPETCPNCGSVNTEETGDTDSDNIEEGFTVNRRCLLCGCSYGSVYKAKWSRNENFSAGR